MSSFANVEATCEQLETLKSKVEQMNKDAAEMKLIMDNQTKKYDINQYKKTAPSRSAWGQANDIQTYSSYALINLSSILKQEECN